MRYSKVLARQLLSLSYLTEASGQMASEDKADLEAIPLLLRNRLPGMEGAKVCARGHKVS